MSCLVRNYKIRGPKPEDYDRETSCPIYNRAGKISFYQTNVADYNVSRSQDLPVKHCLVASPICEESGTLQEIIIPVRNVRSGMVVPQFFSNEQIAKFFATLPRHITDNVVTRTFSAFSVDIAGNKYALYMHFLPSNFNCNVSEIEELFDINIFRVMSTVLHRPDNAPRLINNTLPWFNSDPFTFTSEWMLFNYASSFIQKHNNVPINMIENVSVFNIPSLCSLYSPVAGNQDFEDKYCIVDNTGMMLKVLHVNDFGTIRPCFFTTEEAYSLVNSARDQTGNPKLLHHVSVISTSVGNDKFTLTVLELSDVFPDLPSEMHHLTNCKVELTNLMYPFSSPFLLQQDEVQRVFCGKFVFTSEWKLFNEAVAVLSHN